MTLLQPESVCDVCDVFRVSVQSGTSKFSMAASQTVRFAASDTSQEQGESLTVQLDHL